MQISFFEEFPTKKNLDKLKLCDFSVNLYIAAESLKNFLKIEDMIRRDYYNVKEAIYWPVLKKEEGYWFSPFSRHDAMRRVMDELEEHKNPVTILWDAELPKLKKSLMFTEAARFSRNRNMIRQFFKDSKKNRITIHTAEYPVESKLFNWLLRAFCLSFDTVYDHHKIGMLYTSMIKKKRIEEFMLKKIRLSKKKHGSRFKAGLGVIAKGVANEPLLSDKNLKRDLCIIKREKIEDTVIFRLGGLDKKYVDVIKEFL